MSAELVSSAPAADCQQAGLVTVDAPQITIRHGWTNDPYPEGWTLCVADNSVTYKRGGHMDIYTIEKGFLAFAARKGVMPDADQIGNSKPATSPGVTAGAAGLLDEVRRLRRALNEAMETLGEVKRNMWRDASGQCDRDDFLNRKIVQRITAAIAASRAALARVKREVG